MAKSEDYQQIVALVEQALADPQIAADQTMVKLLGHIGQAALQQEDYFDLKNEFQPHVSNYARAHGNQLPAVLLSLLRVVQTPKAWSGL